MVNFDKETHTYTLNDKVLISTTQLMQKFGLAPSYEGVNTELLEKAAERGTMVHQEIENYIKNGEIGFSNELGQFIAFCRKYPQIVEMKSETIVHNDLVAGTIDFIYRFKNRTVIADFKTTSAVHKNAVAWQLSIYAYLYDKENYEDISIQVFHFNKGNLEIHDLQLKSKNEVEMLMKALESESEYLESSNLLPTELQNELVRIETEFSLFETFYKQMKAKRDEIYSKIKQAMEEGSITSVQTNKFKITYVAPSKKETIDKSKLEAELPEIAEKYTKTTTVKSSIRITLKGEK